MLQSCNLCPGSTSQARIITYARRCGKETGSGWPRDTRQSPLLNGDKWGS